MEAALESAPGAHEVEVFFGLLNEGVLIFAKSAGALNTLTSDADVDSLVAATRRVVQRWRD